MCEVGDAGLKYISLGVLLDVSHHHSVIGATVTAKIPNKTQCSSRKVNVYGYVAVSVYMHVCALIYTCLLYVIITLKYLMFKTLFFPLLLQKKSKLLTFP